MEVWQICLLGYIGALLLWLVINGVFLLISIIIKHKVFEVLEAITAVLAVILSIATGLGDIALIIWLFQNNYTFWGVVAIILGISIVAVAGELLSLPFIGITAGFSSWYDESEFRK